MKKEPYNPIAVYGDSNFSESGIETEFSSGHSTHIEPCLEWLKMLTLAEAIKERQRLQSEIKRLKRQRLFARIKLYLKPIILITYINLIPVLKMHSLFLFIDLAVLYFVYYSIKSQIKINNQKINSL